MEIRIMTMRAKRTDTKVARSAGHEIGCWTQVCPSLFQQEAKCRIRADPVLSLSDAPVWHEDEGSSDSYNLLCYRHFVSMGTGVSSIKSTPLMMITLPAIACSQGRERRHALINSHAPNSHQSVKTVSRPQETTRVRV